MKTSHDGEEVSLIREKENKTERKWEIERQTERPTVVDKYWPDGQTNRQARKRKDFYNNADEDADSFPQT